LNYRSRNQQGKVCTIPVQFHLGKNPDRIAQTRGYPLRSNDLKTCIPKAATFNQRDFTLWARILRRGSNRYSHWTVVPWITRTRWSIIAKSSAVVARWTLDAVADRLTTGDIQECAWWAISTTRATADAKLAHWTMATCLLTRQIDALLYTIDALTFDAVRGGGRSRSQQAKVTFRTVPTWSRQFIAVTVHPRGAWLLGPAPPWADVTGFALARTRLREEVSSRAVPSRITRPRWLR
jgi:hypothetical protein